MSLRLLSSTVLALSALAATAQAETKLEAIQSKGVAIVGVALEPPLSILTTDNKLTGADPDVLRAVFAEFGNIDLEANVVDWGALIPGLMADRFDAVATGLFIRPDRCEAVVFSEPTICSGEALIVRKGNPKALTSYEAIVASDAIMPTVAGTEEARAREAGMPDSRMMIVPDVFAAVDLLKSGRVDVIGFPDVTLAEAMKSLSADEFELIADLPGEPVSCSGVAFNPEQKDLRDAFDAGLKKLQESGKHGEILASYGYNPALAGTITRTELCGGEN